VTFPHGQLSPQVGGVTFSQGQLSPQVGGVTFSALAVAARKEKVRAIVAISLRIVCFPFSVGLSDLQ
jgi:hypothetical protein